MLKALLALAIGYLAGSFPSAYLLARLKGHNIFKLGSGNMGAMNVARNLSPALGLAVLALDVAKGALASFLGLLLSPAPHSLLPAFSAGLGAVLGHAYSLYLKGRGGKALATTLGVALPLYPLAAFVALAALLVLMAFSRRVACSVVLTALLYPAITLLLPQRYPLPSWHYALATAAIAAIVILKHLGAARQELMGQCA